MFLLKKKEECGNKYLFIGTACSSLIDESIFDYSWMPQNKILTFVVFVLLLCVYTHLFPVVLVCIQLYFLHFSMDTNPE